MYCEVWIGLWEKGGGEKGSGEEIDGDKVGDKGVSGEKVEAEKVSRSPTTFTLLRLFFVGGPESTSNTQVTREGA